MRNVTMISLLLLLGVTVGCTKQPVAPQSSEQAEDKDKEVTTEVVSKTEPEQQISDTSGQDDEIAPTLSVQPSVPETNLVSAPKDVIADADETPKIIDAISASNMPSKTDRPSIEASAPTVAPVVKVADTSLPLVQPENNEVAQVETTDTATGQSSEVDLSKYSFYGDPTQPGYQLQEQIFTLVEQGYSIADATQLVVNNVVSDESSTVGAEAKRIIGEDGELSEGFIENIAQVTELSDATRIIIAEYPTKVENVVSLGVTLYPDYAQVVINSAALSGEISDADALLLAIAAGADPTTVSTATASGAPAAGGIGAAAPTPLGPGVGAGGAGGGDTTASTN